MIADNVLIKVHCDKCKECREVDLVALREQTSGSYSLLNRRCRCRLTPGCDGWNSFMYLGGVMRMLVEPEVRDRWLAEEMRNSLNAIREASARQE